MLHHIQWLAEQFCSWANFDYDQLSEAGKKKTVKPHKTFRACNNAHIKELNELKRWESKGSTKKIRDQMWRSEEGRRQFDTMLENESKFWLTDQIVSMWWVPTRNIQHRSSEKKILKTIPGHDKGKPTEGRIEMLNTEWVWKNMGEKTRHFLQSKNSNRRFVLPAGDARTDKTNMLECAKVPNAPTCFCQQNDTKTCVFNSFASCSHHIGHKTVARAMNAAAIKQSPKADNMDRLRNAVNTQLGKPCSVRKHKHEKLDLFNDSMLHEEDGRAFPTIAILQGADGGVEHTVTLWGNWLFDSNVQVALPITRDVLDWCVVGKHRCVFAATRFFLPKPKFQQKGDVKKG